MLTTEQLEALKALRDALGKCTDSEFFDTGEAWDAITPQVINDFCDGVAALDVPKYRIIRDRKLTGWAIAFGSEYPMEGFATEEEAHAAAKRIVQEGQDDYEAKREGWALFVCDDGIVRIQRLDDPHSVCEEWPLEPMFDSDEAALVYVRKRAANGSEMHIRALAQHNKPEK